jgi:hypothetical protein
MQVSKQLLKEAGLHPKLRLLIKVSEDKAPEATGKHKVRLIKDKIITKTDPKTGKPYEAVRYLVEENGELKTYDTRKLNKDTCDLSYLVQKLAEYPENSYVILEGKRQGIKNYISVTPVNTAEDIAVEEVEDDGDEDMELPDAEVNL